MLVFRNQMCVPTKLMIPVFEHHKKAQRKKQMDSLFT